MLQEVNKTKFNHLQANLPPGVSRSLPHRRSNLFFKPFSNHVLDNLLGSSWKPGLIVDR